MYISDSIGGQLRGDNLKSAPSVAWPILAACGGRCRKARLGVCLRRSVVPSAGTNWPGWPPGHWLFTSWWLPSLRFIVMATVWGCLASPRKRIQTVMFSAVSCCGGWEQKENVVIVVVVVVCLFVCLLLLLFFWGEWSGGYKSLEVDSVRLSEFRSCVKVEVASWASRLNEPYGFCGRKATLNCGSALVTVCP